MLLPQSSAFAALKNRLNSVSSIGYLHIAPRPYVPSSSPLSSHSRQGSVVEAIQSLQAPSPRSKFSTSIDAHTAPLSNATTPSGSSFDRSNRLKGRDEGIIRWGELLEKFRSVQERARRAQRLGGDLDDRPTLGVGDLRIMDAPEMASSKAPVGRAGNGPPVPVKDPPAPTPPAAKPRSGLGRQFGRLGASVSGRGKRGQQ
jgi:vacuole morphology and inheritance protein 14